MNFFSCFFFIFKFKCACHGNSVCLSVCVGNATNPEKQNIPLYQHWYPPSTTMFSPVVYEDAELESK